MGSKHLSGRAVEDREPSAERHKALVPVCPAEVDAWLGRKAQIKTGGVRGTEARHQPPLPSWKELPNCSILPLPSTQSWLCGLYIPLSNALHLFAKSPLKLDFPLRSSLPCSPLQCKQLMSPGHDCLLERWAHVLTLQSIPPV